jgi:hypothetical protein
VTFQLKARGIDMNNTRDPQGLVTESIPTARRYFNFTNTILGVAAFNAGLACISTNKPKLFGWMSLVFLIFAWLAGAGVFRKRLAILTNIGHRMAKPKAVAQAMAVALLGVIFLSSVAFGLVDANGFHLF